jgi:hypothetical protein
MESRAARNVFVATFPAEPDTPAQREARGLVERAIRALADAQEQRVVLDERLKLTEAAIARSVELRQSELADLVAQLYRAAGTLGRAERADGQPAEHLVLSLRRIVHDVGHFDADMERAVEADVVSWAIDSFYDAA